MIVSSGPAWFSARSLAVLRSVGGWMTIAPEKTYVATSIRGLGVCKSTYCKAERREPKPRARVPAVRLAAVFGLALAACGLLSGFAGHRQAEARDMAEPDQLGPGIADCQKSAAPVSSDRSAGDAAAATPACGSAPAMGAADTPSAGSLGLADASEATARGTAAARVGFAGG